MNNFKIKVCGITDEKNYLDLLEYPIDYFGFIFYKKSPRYILQKKDVSFIKNIPNKVGVFVNEDINDLLKIIKEYNFKTIQLHGNESIEYCKKLKKMGIKVIKSLLIKNDSISNSEINSNNYDYLLFDYKSKKFGGSGKNFNWSLLNKLSINKPYFLSGGISLENIKNLNKINDKTSLYALDLNSKFEKYPGYKDIKLIDKFFKTTV